MAEPIIEDAVVDEEPSDDTEPEAESAEPLYESAVVDGQAETLVVAEEESERINAEIEEARLSVEMAA